MIRENLTEPELFMMRRTAGSGRVYAETVEEQQTLIALKKKKIMTAQGLTKKGWISLNEIDDDRWSD
jgi:hypothetical protein